MNIRRTGERKNIAVFAILPTVCEGRVIFTTSQPRGLVIPASRKVTSTPGIRPKPFGVPVAQPQLIFDN